MDFKVTEMLCDSLTVIILLPEDWGNERWSVLLSNVFFHFLCPILPLLSDVSSSVFFPTFLPHLLVPFSLSPICFSTIFLHLFFSNNCTEESPWQKLFLLWQQLFTFIFSLNVWDGSRQLSPLSSSLFTSLVTLSSSQQSDVCHESTSHDPKPQSD